MRSVLLLPAVASLFCLANCGRPTLDVSSDQAYAESLAELRAALSSDREREFLDHMVSQLRAWREPEHEELMDVPALTPRQEHRIEELELQHKVKIHEMLHGEDVNGIARSYRRLLLAQYEKHQAWLIDRIKEVEELQSIAGEVLAIGVFNDVHRTSPFLTRTNRFRVTNNGESIFSGVVSLSCLPQKEWGCREEQCEVYSIQFSGGLDGELRPGGARDLEDLEIVWKSEYSPTDDVGEKYEKWRCWTNSATIGDDFKTCCFATRPEQEMKELRERVESLKEESQKVSSKTTFDEFFTRWIEQEEKAASSFGGGVKDRVLGGLPLGLALQDEGPRRAIILGG